MVTGAVVKPVKIVTNAGVDIVRKPLSEAVKLVRPNGFFRRNPR